MHFLQFIARWSKAYGLVTAACHIDSSLAQRAGYAAEWIGAISALGAGARWSGLAYVSSHNRACLR